MPGGCWGCHPPEGPTRGGSPTPGLRGWIWQGNGAGKARAGIDEEQTSQRC